ncbi:hypothetical protein TrRE_jg13373 [Triparma retinervis]|uniref:1-alkyl-2-acetylglycerophosphocholine esterase n=1 Tax=Triparma retinervis TaxID=2557542 RepID=A0A9W7FZY4_9STRA|nr:hypothetical protein TrRE_jg13373 [Triparma retinervis]
MLAFGGTKLSIASDAPTPLNSKRRVIIWSHGLATWGSHYSFMCRMLTTMSDDNDAVVIAINHTDGSATASETLGGEEILYQVVGKGNPKEREIRAEQLKIRAKDVAKAWEAIKGMNEKGDLEGTFDTSGFVVAGHSFGGGTAVATGIAHEDCVGVMAFDPWMVPVQDAGFLERAKDCKPVLSITCDAGALSSPPYWRSNCSLLQSLPEDSTKVVRFKGSDHIDISDVALMLPNPRLTRPSAEDYFLGHKRFMRDFMMSIGWIKGKGGGSTVLQEGEEAWVQHVPPY